MSTFEIVTGSQRQIAISAEQMWDSENQWTLGLGSSETRWQLVDDSSDHPLFAGVPIAARAADARKNKTYITSLLLGCEGISYTVMPSAPAKVRLISKVDGTLVTITDTSANTTALNLRHIVGGVLDTPLPVEVSDKLLVEVGNPIGGTSTAWRSYAVLVGFCEGHFLNDDGSSS